jgi:hypothetical protein
MGGFAPVALLTLGVGRFPGSLRLFRPIPSIADHDVMTRSLFNEFRRTIDIGVDQQGR